MNAITLGSESVLMPVELRFAPLVAEFLDGLRAGRTVATGDHEMERVLVPGEGEWTQSMIEGLVESLRYEGVVGLFDLCAEARDTWVLKSEAEEAQGISAIQLRNELGALSKLTKRMFRTEKSTWPVQVKKEQGSYYYRMDKRIAEWWTEARGSVR